MKTIILYDNTAQNGLKSGWGFSALVDDRILFDTGEDSGSLFYNMDRLGIEPDTIEAVVISHDHWDHTGGLRKVLEHTRDLPVYACPDFSKDFKSRVIESGGRLVDTDDFITIDNQILSTGQIAGEYKGEYLPEQALVLRTEHGLSIITGCSHPGIVTIVDKVKQNFPREPVSAVLGGFHLMVKDKLTIESIVKTMRDMGVDKVGPTHCTGDEGKYLFKKYYGKNFLVIEAGVVLDL
ncbi:MBL fold metallo-hydrolase [candidate division KSB1 bacterium]|nr:MBL fold metallo-hydrolase [candidate division KSB1 bacterium]